MNASYTPEQQASIQHQLQHLDEDRGDVLLPVDIVCIILATVAVILRFVSRKVAGLPYKADDFTTLVSWVLLAGLCIASLIDVHYGFGRHFMAIGMANFVKALKTTFAYQLIYIVALAVIKSAIVLLYLRIFAASRYRVVFFCVLGFVTVCGVCSLVTSFVQCRPISYNWNRAQEGSCVDLEALFLAAGIINLIGDFLVLIAPVPIVWRLHMSAHRKVIILGIFSVGSFACVVSFVRLFYVKRLLAFDATFDGWLPGMLSVIEPHVGLVCACLPTMGPLFRRLRQRSKPSGSGYSAGSGRSKVSWPRLRTRTHQRSASRDAFDRLPEPSDQVYDNRDVQADKNDTIALVTQRPITDPADFEFQVTYREDGLAGP